MEHTKSQAAFEEARQYIPGGVNSPVRSFRSVGGVPPVSYTHLTLPTRLLV